LTVAALGEAIDGLGVGPSPLGKDGATASGLTRRVRVASLVRSWDADHRL